MGAGSQSSNLNETITLTETAPTGASAVLQICQFHVEQFNDR